MNHPPPPPPSPHSNGPKTAAAASSSSSSSSDLTMSCAKLWLIILTVVIALVALVAILLPALATTIWPTDVTPDLETATVSGAITSQSLQTESIQASTVQLSGAAASAGGFFVQGSAPPPPVVTATARAKILETHIKSFASHATPVIAASYSKDNTKSIRGSATDHPYHTRSHAQKLVGVHSMQQSNNNNSNSNPPPPPPPAIVANVSTPTTWNTQITPTQTTIPNVLVTNNLTIGNKVLWSTAGLNCPLISQCFPSQGNNGNNNPPPPPSSSGQCTGSVRTACGSREEVKFGSNVGMITEDVFSSSSSGTNLLNISVARANQPLVLHSSHAMNFSLSAPILSPGDALVSRPSGFSFTQQFAQKPSVSYPGDILAGNLYISAINSTQARNRYEDSVFTVEPSYGILTNEASNPLQTQIYTSSVTITGSVTNVTTMSPTPANVGARTIPSVRFCLSSETSIGCSLSPPVSRKIPGTSISPPVTASLSNITAVDHLIVQNTCRGRGCAPSVTIMLNQYADVDVDFTKMRGQSSPAPAIARALPRGSMFQSPDILKQPSGPLSGVFRFEVGPTVTKYSYSGSSKKCLGGDLIAPRGASDGSWLISSSQAPWFDYRSPVFSANTSSSIITNEIYPRNHLNTIADYATQPGVSMSELNRYVQGGLPMIANFTYLYPGAVDGTGGCANPVEIEQKHMIVQATLPVRATDENRPVGWVDWHASFDIIAGQSAQQTCSGAPATSCTPTRSTTSCNIPPLAPPLRPLQPLANLPPLICTCGCRVLQLTPRTLAW